MGRKPSDICNMDCLNCIYNDCIHPNPPSDVDWERLKKRRASKRAYYWRKKRRERNENIQNKSK